MTNCTFILKDEKVKTIIIRGHAGYAEIGKDIICASISTLAYNLEAGLDLALDEVNTKAHDGNFELYLKDEQVEKAYFFTESFKMTITALREGYPDYVKINEVI